MLSRKTLIFLSVLAVLALVGFLARPETSAAQTVTFIKIIDGDSLLVQAEGRSMEVRLLGVDAPELRQEFSRKSREFSLRFCYGHKLRLEFDKQLLDRHGRVLAYVHRGDRMLNREIIKAGLAIAVKVKPNTRHYTTLKAAEQSAQKEKRGFWRQGGLKMTPAQWRKNHPRKRTR